MKIKNWLKNTIDLFSDLKNSRLDSEILLSYVLNKSRTWIMTFDNKLLNNFQISILNKLVIRRMKHEPIAYIIKKKEFWSLSIKVSKHVLIPRPDTEILVEQTLNRLKNHYKVLDLGIGSGAISLAIAYEKSSCLVTGIDYFKKAINIANYNAKLLNLNNINFYFSNWFSCINKKFNIIVSNPPYLSKKDIFYLEKDIFFEPKTSLFSKDNGLSDIKIIVKNAQKYLFTGGWLLIEHGYKQKKIVFDLFKKYNFFDIKCYKDYQGHDRVIAGRKFY